MCHSDLRVAMARLDKNVATRTYLKQKKNYSQIKFLLQNTACDYTE
jgi:hypothetical protein